MAEILATVAIFSLPFFLKQIVSGDTHFPKAKNIIFTYKK